MLRAVKGIYENGFITLDESLPVQKGKVIVTLLEEVEDKSTRKRIFGSMKGSVKIGIDFNDPLDDLKEYM